MKTFIKSAVKHAALFSFAALMLMACKPDPLPDNTLEGDEAYVSLVDSLENVMFRQAKAMQFLLTGEDVLVASCVENEKENLYEITLASGAASTSFLIDADPENTYMSVLSYTETEGQMCWALRGKEGNVAALEGADGNKLPLTAALDVKVEDKTFVLKSGENSYKTEYVVDDKVQMFSCAPLADMNGVIYAVEFTFGADLKKVAYLSEYAGIYFYLTSDESKTAVSEMYVNTQGKATLAVSLPAENVWTPVVPEGWNAAVRKEGDVSYVDITAPAQFEVTEENQPMLQAVSLDGMHVFASVALDNKQFKALTISVTDAVITPVTGLGKFAYGISLLSSYNSQEVLALAQTLISGQAQPSTGNAVSEAPISKSFAEILGSPLDPEARYVLWAVADGKLRELEFGEIAVNIDIVSTSLLDAQIDVMVSGATSIFGGLVEKSDDMMETILYQVTNLIYDPVAVGQKYEYNGEASKFMVEGNLPYQLMPNTSYAIWIVPAVDGEYIYSEKDVVIAEFKTNDVIPGGALEITCGQPEVTPSSISFPLSCEGAEMIYYAYFTKEGGSRYAAEQVPNDAKFEQIVLEDTDIRKGGYVTVLGNKVDAIGRNFNDEAATEYWLYAVAVDSEGKYGKVHCVSAKTLALAYDNSISLKVETLETTSTTATVKVTSTGGDLSDYIYWMGRTTDPFWANSGYCGSTPTNAQKYMALNPEDEQIAASMRQYGSLAEDGTIKFEGLTPSTEVDGTTQKTQYVFLILEKGDTYYSPVGYKLITTLSVTLGNIVKEGTPEWNAARESIKIDWHKEAFEQPPHLMAFYSFDITVPKNLTTYIMCAGEGYYEELKFTKIEQFMIEIEKYSSRRMDLDHVVMEEDGSMRNEPDYYKNGKLCAGQLMSVHDFYVHGSAHHGRVTYFAEGSHGANNCSAWKNGACENYARAQSMIEYYSSIESYLKRAAAFGLSGTEAEQWAQALLEAYTFYYKDATPKLYINDGSPLYVENSSAIGINEDGVVLDRVYIMFKDLQGNYYEPMKIEVPNYFE